MVIIIFGLQRFFQSFAKYAINNDPLFKLLNEATGKMKVTRFVLKNDGQRRSYFQNVAQYEIKHHRLSETNDDDKDF